MSTPSLLARLGRLILLALAVVGAVTLVVVGVLAVENFNGMALRSKRSEAPTLVDRVRERQLAHHREHGAFLALPACPSGPPGRSAVPWEGACTDAWARLGFAPEGKVRCRVWTEVGPGPWGPAGGLAVLAACDIDGDGTPSLYWGTAEERASMLTANDVF